MTARFRLELREEAARPRGQAAAARLAQLQCAGLRSRPGRVVLVAREPMRPLWCMERLMAALHAPFLPRVLTAHAHTPLATALAPAVGVRQGPLRTVFSMHARSV